MRITFILPADSLAGGIRVLAVYASELSKRGHEVTVVQPRHDRLGMRHIAKSMLKMRAWPKSPDAGPSYFDGIAFQRVKLDHVGPITDSDVPDGDIVICTWWETAEWVWGLAPSKGIKAHFMQDYEIWGGNIDRVDATCRLPIYKIVIAKWVWDLLSTKFGQQPVALIPNSVDTSLFHAPRRAKQSIPTVGFTYTTMHNKGTDISIAAINLVRKKFPNLRVICFGSSMVSRELPLPINSEFFFHVVDKALPAIYASCDAWLFGTRIEGFGLPILEAMACRTPVIGTPAGAAPDLLSKGGGIEVAMEDVQAMAAAIIRIVDMPEREWTDMSDAGYLTATSYTWADATDKLERAILYIKDGTTIPKA